MNIYRFYLYVPEGILASILCLIIVFFNDWEITEGIELFLWASPFIFTFIFWLLNWDGFRGYKIEVIKSNPELSKMWLDNIGNKFGILIIFPFAGSAVFTFFLAIYYILKFTILRVTELVVQSKMSLEIENFDFWIVFVFSVICATVITYQFPKRLIFSFEKLYLKTVKEFNYSKQKPPFQKALQQCETKIADFSQKLQAAKAKLQQLPTIEYLNEKEKQAFSQQITQSQSLYQNQLNNYASSFFKLHLFQQKQQLGTIINEVFYQNNEVDSNELNVITENINSLLAHDYWQYTDMDKSTYQALQPILAKLKKVDQRETFAEQVADLAPTKDLLNLDDHELQTQIELADLKNTENLAQQTLTEFTQSTQLLNDELARLQAENEVADRFG